MDILFLRPGRTALVAVLAGVAGVAGPAGAAEDTFIGELTDPNQLRVCADPANLPFSNEAGEGFENKIAELLAEDLGRELSYFWFPQSMGFVRVTLGARQCDVVIGVATTNELMQNTNPYYRSSYVMVQRADAAEQAVDLQDPVLGELRVGAVARTPPVTVLARNGLLDHFVPYTLVVDTRVESPARQLVQDVAAGTVDVGLVWGPVGGYWAERQDHDLDVAPVTGPPDVRMDYRISMGLRRGEPRWRATLNDFLARRQDDIEGILLDYGVPLLDAQGQPIAPVAAVAEPPEEKIAPIPEPDDYRMANYRAPVPGTLEGAAVVDAAGVETLMREANPVLIDVLPAPRKPADWPDDKIWNQPSHQTLPGAVWLPNVGYGPLPDDYRAWFASELERLTGGQRDRSLVFFCEADCWMSWNAAKRAMELGYTNVAWYPEGTTGWAAQDRFMVQAELPEMPDFVPLERPAGTTGGGCKEEPCASADG